MSLHVGVRMSNLRPYKVEVGVKDIVLRSGKYTHCVQKQCGSLSWWKEMARREVNKDLIDIWC